MEFKFVIVFALVAITKAAVIVPATPVVKTHAPLAVPILSKTAELVEYDPHPQYQYGYDVRDSLSGDSKGHVEERDGDLVRGEYSLIDADGFKRTVTYTADSVNGFNAVVRREPLVVPAPVVKTAILPSPIVKAAPIAVAPVAAPIVNAAPVRFAAPTYAVRNL